MEHRTIIYIGNSLKFTTLNLSHWWEYRNGTLVKFDFDVDQIEDIIGMGEMCHLRQATENELEEILSKYS